MIAAMFGNRKRASRIRERARTGGIMARIQIRKEANPAVARNSMYLGGLSRLQSGYTEMRLEVDGNHSLDRGMK